jgi:hypothetical protein
MTAWRFVLGALVMGAVCRLLIRWIIDSRLPPR